MEWNDEINDIWNLIQKTTKNVADLYPVIWKTSMERDNREVQVVIDDNDNIFSSIGSPSFVAFMQAPVGLKLPIKEWIHTHPFGKAYFSGTDLRTIAIYRNHMMEATVLGENERMALKFGVGLNGEDYQEYVQHTFIGDEEE